MVEARWARPKAPRRREQKNWMSRAQVAAEEANRAACMPPMVISTLRPATEAGEERKRMWAAGVSTEGAMNIDCCGVET